jgi:3-phenylpropionate/cinnamic acid dioxygenase small subunit
MVEDIVSELARVSAELEIRGLLARLAQLSDSGEVDTYVTLFTEDAVWELSESPRSGLAASTQRGRDAIGEGARERLRARANRPGVQTMHFIATTAVEVKGEAATAVSYFQFVASGPTGLGLQNAGHYDDTFHKTDYGWKLAHRVISFA